MRWHRPAEAGHYVLLLVLLAVWPADAAVTDYIGKPVVEIRVQSNGVPLQDPTLLEVIETRAGQPLAMADVRETMAHLFGLGLYQDVQVDASLRSEGVVLVYNLVPAARVARIAFEGTLGVAEGDLRRIVTERHGAAPSFARAAQTSDTLKQAYRDRGYPKASVAARFEPGRTPSTGTLMFTVQAGPRARISSIDVQGAPLDPVPAVLDELDLQTGDYYDGVGLDQRLGRYADDLRTRGYYEARGVHLARYAEDDSVVQLVLSIEPGPRVEIAFEGDPLTSAERDRLVPIVR